MSPIILTCSEAASELSHSAHIARVKHCTTLVGRLFLFASLTLFGLYFVTSLPFCIVFFGGGRVDISTGDFFLKLYFVPCILFFRFLVLLKLLFSTFIYYFHNTVVVLYFSTFFI